MGEVIDLEFLYSKPLRDTVSKVADEQLTELSEETPIIETTEERADPEPAQERRQETRISLNRRDGSTCA